jgi:hypothetical protein
VDENLCSLKIKWFEFALLLEILLSRGEGYDPINPGYTTIFLFLFLVRTWIPYMSWTRGLIVFNDLMLDIVRFVYIGGTVDHQCLNFFFITLYGSFKNNLILAGFTLIKQ